MQMSDLYTLEDQPELDHEQSRYSPFKTEVELHAQIARQDY